jgi:hypothetical protein
MVAWQNSAQYDVGVFPSVAGFLAGGFDWLVEVHQAFVDLNGTQLLYDTFFPVPGPFGEPEPSRWASQGQYDVGFAPAVAIDSVGLGTVEVHQSSWAVGPLWYRYWDPNASSWGPSIQYDSGHAPSVSVSSNVFIEVHDDGAGSLWYHVGTAINGIEIAWGPSFQYDNGYYPSVSVVGNTVVEVHQGSTSCPGPMWYRVGTIQGQQIVWSASYQYDNGCAPSVATDGQLVFEVHQGSFGVGPLWSRLGFL